MKTKIATCLVCVLTALSLQAQSKFFSAEKSTEPIAFSVRGGLNLSKWALSTDISSDELIKSKMQPGAHLGVSVDIPFLESLHFLPGVYFSMKGQKYTAKEDIMDGGANHTLELQAKMVPMYIEIPILASYRYRISSDVELQVNAGPYIAVGVGGKTKIKVKEDGEVIDVPFLSGEGKIFGEDGYKRFDAGLQFGAGVKFNRFYAGISYDLGLANILKDTPNEHIKNRTFALSVGYYFSL